MKGRQWAAFLGVSCGIIAAAFMLPGGFDAFHFFLRDWFPTTTAPAWVYLITSPIGKLPWPFSWALWTSISITGIGLAYLFINRNNRWWIIIISPLLVYEFWLGQTEFLSIAGLAIGIAIIRKKIPGWWIGAAWMLLLTKPQTGLAAVGLFTLWLLMDKRWKDLILSTMMALSILGACFIFWPTWLVDWTHILLDFSPTPSGNASVGWIGFLALIPLLISVRGTRERQLRMFLAANLLVSPYLNLYHCVVYQVTEDRPACWAGTWAIFVTSLLLYKNPTTLGAFIPLTSLLADTWTLLSPQLFSAIQGNKHLLKRLQ